MADSPDLDSVGVGCSMFELPAEIIQHIVSFLSLQGKFIVLIIIY